MMQKIKTYTRHLTTALLTERLEPGRAAAAVFLGIFIGIVPIYGFQLLAAIALAIFFKLNKPLVVAATFINNPFLQPLIVISSVETGFFLRHGYFHPFKLSALTGAHVKDDLLSWFLGSLVVGLLVASVGAAITAIVVYWKMPKDPALRERVRFVNRTFDRSSIYSRSFVRWKMRLDRIFGILTAEDLGSGTVIDLGCGYGMALCLTAFEGSDRRLVGCDLNAHRVAVARQALNSLNAEVSVGDARSFGLSSAGLILIMDVLQYLPAEEQAALLMRCCSALDPEGRLIFRTHDRECGLRSTITLALDRLLFFFQRAGTRPLTLSASQYRRVLESAGMEVETRHFRNHLPLAHILFIAKRPFCGEHAMMVRVMRGVGRLVIAYPGIVAGVSLCLTLFLYANIHNLRTGTDLTDMFGKHDPQWQAVSQIGKELGYGNQLYILIEAPTGDADKAGAMEDMADRLTAEMMASGLFKQARSGVQEEELVKAARFYAWNFPSYATPGQVSELKRRLDPQQIHKNVRQTAAAMVTPFSSMGVDYFVADPLGLMSVAAGDGKDLSQFGNFDMSWGSGDRFFSKDHTALLMIAEPRESAVDYKFAGQVVQWTQAHIDAIRAEPGFHDSGIDGIQAGPYVYAGQDHTFIVRNIKRVSLISILGNLVLCLLVYPNIPMLLLSLIPANLGILWTTGIASFYPGEVNLISLAFIAILAGLGDDQVVHFFNRTPQEWSKGGTLNAALLRTYETTGLSVVLCILTAATATIALAASEFKALAEFGFILTVGMFAMMFHTLLTVPALMQLWERFFKPRAPKAITFRFLPYIARKIVDLTGRHARLIVAGASALFLLSMLTLPSIKLDKHLEIGGGADNAAVAGQKSLSEKFGIEGSPNLMLIAGSQEDVLRRAEELTAGLESYRQRGAIQSIFSPTSLLPSIYTQKQRAALLTKVDLAASAQALEASLREAGMQVEPHQPYIDRLQELAHGARDPVTLETASGALPAGLLDSSIRKTEDGSYVAAIAYYVANPDNAQVVPDNVLESWRKQYGPFVSFSFEKINRDMQSRLLRDSRRALLWTAVGIGLIVYLTFRNLRVSLLVLMPIVFAIIVAFGLLRLAGHHFSFMSITAIPLIIGIGIDNGIHLIRRYQESAGSNILAVAKNTGAPLIQSNLTTIIGFGALTASTFAPLAELGLVASLGVALALVGGLCLIPAVIVLDEKKKHHLKIV